MDVSLNSMFPHEHIRPIQDLLITDLQNCFKEKKILLAHAPTGLGKTASALSVAVPWAIENKKKVFFLTNRHTQHQIAINTLRLIQEKTGEKLKCADLVGKKWMCNQDVAGLFGNEFNEYCKAIVEKGECPYYNAVRTKNGLTVEGKLALKKMQERIVHNEEIIAYGKEKQMCSYELAAAMAKEAQIIIGDYYYLFNPFIRGTLFNKMEISFEDVIVIVDEGHNLPGRITEMMSNVLSSYMIKNAVMEAKKYGYGGVISWLQEINRILNELAQFEVNKNGFQDKEKLVAKEQFSAEVRKVVDYDELINELEMAADEIRKKQRKSYLGGIAAFLDAWQGSDDGFTRILSEKIGKYGPVTQLQYLCLDPSLITKEIFGAVFSGVIMSGTLKPTFMYKDVLGIDKSLEREYGSPFPPENKLNLIVPETSTKYSLRGEAMYKRIAEKCSEMVQFIPGNVAVFFPSYDLRDKVSIHLVSEKKKFWEKSEMSKDEKEVFLNEFREAKVIGGVLLGVSGANFAEGIDLPGDFLNGVIVVGLPLSRPDLKTQEIVKYFDKKFGKGWDYGYVYPAINKCLQSAGRCIRSETDKGAVIYLDERFAWQNYFICFPKEGLIVSKEYGKLLKKFFGKNN